MDLRKWDPTGGWPTGVVAAVVVDVDAGTVNGVSPGDPLERLAPLGRAEAAFPMYTDDRRHLIGGTWHYASVGLSVSAVDGRVESFDVDFDPAPTGDRRFLVGGAPVAIDVATPETQLVQWLGAVYWRHVTPAVVTLFIEGPRGEWMVELSPDGGLRSLSLQDPLLATKEGRSTYGVTAPWPPTTTAGEPPRHG